MASLVDVCRWTAVSSGTGDFVVSAAVTGYMAPLASGAVNGGVYSYRAESANLGEWEVGIGTYTSGTTTLARTTVLYNSLGTTAKINFTAAPQVALVALAADITQPVRRVVFRAGRSAAQTLSHNSTTKVQFNVETIDTNSNYDNTTNYRFQPTVAGYYQINFSLLISGTASRSYTVQATVYKNGALDTLQEYGGVVNTGATIALSVSSIISFNGSSDYVEAFAYQFDYTASASVNITNSSTFSGSFQSAT